MDTKVLVAYASKHGATAEIAEKMGQVLREADLAADVLPADRVTDLSPYTAVVLGSAMYIGRWRKEASNFLKDNEQALAERPLWIFSSGPTGEGDPVELSDGWIFPKGLQDIADRIKPREITIFHGNVDMDKLGFLEKRMIKGVKAPVGDFRDWEAIASWTQGIAEALEQAT